MMRSCTVSAESCVWSSHPSQECVCMCVCVCVCGCVCGKSLKRRLIYPLVSYYMGNSWTSSESTRRGELQQSKIYSTVEMKSEPLQWLFKQQPQRRWVYVNVSSLHFQHSVCREPKWLLFKHSSHLSLHRWTYRRVGHLIVALGFVYRYVQT